MEDKAINAMLGILSLAVCLNGQILIENPLVDMVPTQRHSRLRLAHACC